MKFCCAAEMSWPLHHILQTEENISVCHRPPHKSHHNHMNIFLNENENNYVKISIPSNIAILFIISYIISYHYSNIDQNNGSDIFFLNCSALHNTVL